MPKALIHTKITWAISPPASQVLSVTPGSPCAHGLLGAPHGEVRDIEGDNVWIERVVICIKWLAIWVLGRD